MSSFIKAFDNLSVNTRNGENGAVEHVTTEYPCLDLFFALVRDLPEERLTELVENCLRTKDKTVMVDTLVLIFQTRNCRGGKGEKNLTYLLIKKLYGAFPTTVTNLIELLPTYGYFKDLLHIYEMQDISEALKAIAVNVFAKQLKKDSDELQLANTESRTPQLSLAGKWAPRVGKHFDNFANALCVEMFPNDSKRHQKYRKLVVSLTQALEIPEVYMCANRYSEIDFKRVSSLCLNRFRKAFLNELCGDKRLTDEESETGNRFPTNIDRVTCRNNLKSSVKTGKINGKALMPHELTTKIQWIDSELELQVFEAQWEKIREDVINMCSTGTIDPNGLNLSKLVPLVDVSGSMRGTPMEVAIALGILVSEVTHPNFRDRMITFETFPKWVNLSSAKTLQEKVMQTRSAPWDNSTDFMKAIELILTVVRNNKMPPEEVPDLIVFSDMQFDQADRGYSTHYQLIEQKFRQLGPEYKPPRIIFWNLRGDTSGFPVTANTPNTQMLSGFSPAMLKLVLSGKEIVSDDNTPITPYQTFRLAIDDEVYDPVRLVIQESGEIS